ncbi:MAG: bifunctional oligoribonuclease/PAP phosphatase NrnA [Nitrospirota bacterium]
MNDISGVAEAIKSFKSFIISSHVSPEGDAIGSQLALALSLMKMGKEVRIIDTDPVPEFLRFLPGVELIAKGESIEHTADALIVVDCEPARTGIKGLASAPVKKIINIDHHVTNPKTADIWWVDPEASAAGEMVYDLLVLMGAPIDSDIATNLYTCIFTDTGSFRYTNTDEAALLKASKLISYGVKTWEIAENIYETKSFGRMKLLGLVLSTLEISGDGRLAWVSITEDFYRQTGTSAADTDGFINYPRAVKGVEVAVLFREQGDRVKISFRSKGRVDVSGLASSLGGGGHPNASGVVFAGDMERARAYVLPKVAELVKSVLG